MTKKKIVLPILLIVLGVVVATVAVAVASKYLDQPTEASTACTRPGHTYRVIIENAAITPEIVDAKRCDTLTITNHDAVTREIGFGQHDHHVAYDGVAEKVLRQNESLTITLIATGDYHYHDHFHDEVAGSFVVTD